jgi:hypothetical protein
VGGDARTCTLKVQRCSGDGGGGTTFGMKRAKKYRRTKMEQQGRWDAHRVSATAAPGALRHTPVRWLAVRPVPDPTTGVEPPSVPPHFADDDPAWRVLISATLKSSVFTRNNSTSEKKKSDFTTQRVHRWPAKNSARGAAAGVKLRVCRIAEQSGRCGHKSESSPPREATCWGVLVLKKSPCKNGKGSDSSARNPHTTMDGVSVTATMMPLTIPITP